MQVKSTNNAVLQAPSPAVEANASQGSSASSQMLCLPDELMGACLHELDDKKDLYSTLRASKKMAELAEIYIPQLLQLRRAHLLERCQTSAFTTIKSLPSTAHALRNVQHISLRWADLQGLDNGSGHANSWASLAGACPRLSALTYQHTAQALHTTQADAKRHVQANRILKRIVMGNPKLIDLSFEGLNTVRQASFPQAHPLWRAVGRKSGLRSLALTDVLLTPADMHALFAGTSALGNLRALAYRSVACDPNDATRVADFLPRLTNMTRFSLRSQSTDEANSIIFSGLKHSRRMVLLDLYDFGKNLGGILKTAPQPPALKTLSLIDYAIDTSLEIPVATLNAYLGDADLSLTFVLPKNDKSEFKTATEVRRLYTALNALVRLKHLVLPNNFPWVEAEHFGYENSPLRLELANLQHLVANFSNASVSNQHYLFAWLPHCPALQSLRLCMPKMWISGGMLKMMLSHLKETFRVQPEVRFPEDMRNPPTHFEMWAKDANWGSPHLVLDWLDSAAARQNPIFASHGPKPTV